MENMTTEQFEANERKLILEENEVMEALKVTKVLTDYINTFSDKSNAFNKAMQREHRTLQQAFTKLALSWLEHIANDDYKTDPRNEQSKQIAERLLGLFKEYNERQGYSGPTLDLMSKPSGYLGCI
jgi:uncharacterized membrane-anchored protein YjiN (DUF445 family)